MKSLLILLLLTGCAAHITITTPDGTQVDYESARKAAIAVNANGTVTILTGEVVTDDLATVVEAIGKTATIRDE